VIGVEDANGKPRRGRVARPEREAVGERIRRRRRELGLSQRQLASEGVSYSYLSRVEAGDRTPSVKALRRISSKLGVSVHWLETGAEDPALELARLVLGAGEDSRLPQRARVIARRLLAGASR
jgi:transcriptional regulator with XRE-family HTH domain